MQASVVLRSCIAFAMFIPIGIACVSNGADEPDKNADLFTDKTNKDQPIRTLAHSSNGVFHATCDTAKSLKSREDAIHSKDTPTGGATEIKLEEIASGESINRWKANADIECMNAFVSDDGAVVCIGYGKRDEIVDNLDPIDLVAMKFDVSGKLLWTTRIERKLNLRGGFSTEAQSVPFVDGLAMNSNSDSLFVVAEPSYSGKFFGRWLYVFDCKDGSVKNTFAPISKGPGVPTIFCDAKFFSDNSLIGVVSAMIRPSGESVKAVPVVEIYDAASLVELGTTVLDSLSCEKPQVSGIAAKGWVKECVTKYELTFAKSDIPGNSSWMVTSKRLNDLESHMFQIAPSGNLKK